MNESVDKQRFEELLSRLTEGGLNELELQQLERLIESDRTARHQYLEYCQMHGMLRAEHGLLASWGVPEVEAPSTGLAGKLRSRRTRRALAFWGAAAVLLGILASGVLN